MKINVDAVVRDSNGEICKVSGVNKHGITVEYGTGHTEDSGLLEHGSYEIVEDIRGMYEQQKLRADELERKLNKEVEDGYQMENRWRTEIERADQAEKRWSELKDTVNEFHQEAIFEESRSNDDGDRGIIYACEKILGKISDLEEDGE